MAIVLKSYTFSAGATIIAAEHNSDFDNLYNLVNGNIDNNNISLTANIAGSKLATLGTIGAGAGIIPAVNLPTNLTSSVLVKSDASVNPTNLLSNGDFENWSAGTSVAPDGWVLQAGSVAREASTIKLGTYSAKLTRSGTNTEIIQNIIATKGAAYWGGRTVTFSSWVWCNTASVAKLQIYDGTNVFISANHPGDSAWHRLTITGTLDASPTYLTCYCQVQTTNASAYFDGAMCVEGESAFAFSDKPVTPLYETFVANGASAVTVSDTRVAITDAIVISLNTVGGTVGVQPHVATITGGTGFTVICTALDTSTYNYYLLKR